MWLINNVFKNKHIQNCEFHMRPVGVMQLKYGYIYKLFTKSIYIFQKGKDLKNAWNCSLSSLKITTKRSVPTQLYTQVEPEELLFFNRLHGLNRSHKASASPPCDDHRMRIQFTNWVRLHRLPTCCSSHLVYKSYSHHSLCDPRWPLPPDNITAQSPTAVFTTWPLVQ